MNKLSDPTLFLVRIFIFEVEVSKTLVVTVVEVILLVVFSYSVMKFLESSTNEKG